ncbi:MAG: hypothetical protein ACOX9R_19990 [Armatimonadota bacterium]|jgi:hypothetical protein
MPIDMDASFPRYTDNDPAAPIWCITPEIEGCFHRFFDTSPISPSGRLVGLTRMPAEDRLPEPGEPAEVVVIDLETGDCQSVAETHGWDTQLGAQVQWGASDEELFFIDMDVEQWRPFSVRLNPMTGERAMMRGPLYMVSPDGRTAASPCLRRTRLTQKGYGVIVPDEAIPRNHGAVDDDGLYLTDTMTGEPRLLVSYGRIYRELLDEEQFADGDLYGFHAKWNLQARRLQFVVRWVPHGSTDSGSIRPMLVTLRPDGSELHLAIPADVWGLGGHHPNWTPDGEHVMMNLKLDGENMRLVRWRYDGANVRPMNDELLGTGHPSLHPGGRCVITDDYAHGPLASDDGTTPLRLLDLKSGEETCVARIRTRPDFEGDQKVLRVDPHPAWGPEFRRVAFNACPTGRRDVFIADLSALV